LVPLPKYRMGHVPLMTSILAALHLGAKRAGARRDCGVSSLRQLAAALPDIPTMFGSNTTTAEQTRGSFWRSWFRVDQLRLECKQQGQGLDLFATTDGVSLHLSVPASQNGTVGSPHSSSSSSSSSGRQRAAPQRQHRRLLQAETRTAHRPSECAPGAGRQQRRQQQQRLRRPRPRSRERAATSRSHTRCLRQARRRCQRTPKSRSGQCKSTCSASCLASARLATA
jgi:hypothetical protein